MTWPRVTQRGGTLDELANTHDPTAVRSRHWRRRRIADHSCWTSAITVGPERIPAIRELCARIWRQSKEALLVPACRTRASECLLSELRNFTRVSFTRPLTTSWSTGKRPQRVVINCYGKRHRRFSRMLASRLRLHPLGSSFDCVQSAFRVLPFQSRCQAIPVPVV